MGLYEFWVRLMVWLGAAPPSGYEYLLPEAERQPVPNNPTPVTVVGESRSTSPAKMAGRPSPAPVRPPQVTQPSRSPVTPLSATDEIAQVRELYRNLLVKVMGDKDQANRLIEYERQRKPTATRVELLQNAIDRWVRDNR